MEGEAINSKDDKEHVITRTERGTRKGIFTRCVNKLNRHIVEEDESAVLETMEKMRNAFRDFESLHNRYHGSLQEAEEIDDSDKYFFQAEKEYVSSLKNAKDWPKGLSRIKETHSQKIETTTTSDLYNLMNLPKVELEPFDGNPLNYHSFIATFNEVVDKVITDSRVKLTRLLQSTRGDAKEAIRSCILIRGDEGYIQARKILSQRFGNDHLIIQRTIQSLRNGKPVKSPKDLLQLADELVNCEMMLTQMGRLAEVDSQSCVLEVLSRLQPHLQSRWKRQAIDAKREYDHYPGFTEFVRFVSREADEATDPVYGSLGQSSSTDSKSRPPHHSQQMKTISFTTDAVSQPIRWRPPPCILCSEEHKLLYCAKFKDMKVNERLKLVKDHNLCENCLMGNHTTVNCRKQSVCTVSECGEKHTRFIHVDKVRNDASVNHVVTEPESSDLVVNGNAVTNMPVNLPVIEVIVNDCHGAHALLDTGSTNSFCSKSLMEKLNLCATDSKLTLSTLSGTSKQSTKVVDFKVTSSDHSSCIQLRNVFVVDHIPVRMAPMCSRSYAHLADLPIRNGNAIDILLGQDNSEALLPLEVRKGREGEPFAVRTILGWSLNGPSRAHTSPNSKVIVNFVNVQSLETKVNSLWNIENESIVNVENSMSKNDKRVIDLWDDNCRMVNGHYELPIPWKSNSEIPNNFVMAMSRLKSLQSSLIKRGLMDRYDSEMKKLFTNGYAEPVPKEEIHKCGKVWYVPHQAVITDKKPDKTRIVFDCAAKYQGESLNDKCLQGPDLNNKLLHVLLRFRQYKFAILADIEAMYYQVIMPPNDRDAFRFLWFCDDGSVAHYRMTRHLFGGVWCSSSSTYALRRVCSEAVNVDPIVIDTILRSFYVDDCLKSVATKQEAVKVIHGTKDLLKQGGFNLTKFVVNDSDLLSSVPLDDHAKEVKQLGLEANSKVLGVRWSVADDQFYFENNFKVSDVVTRRSILSTVSSAFDPLGLLSPVVLVGRLLFQEATKLKLGWDDQVPEQLRLRWISWVQDMGCLDDIKVPRCVLPDDADESVIELHHFSDASTKAYGCCSYLRVINKLGNAQVSLLVSKARVAPLKSVTLPRLELQGAVMSAQCDAMLRQELDLSISNSYFWVDSEIVIKYILNESRRFHVFVANRVSIIQELTDPKQWHHIAGKNNPADIVSRGLNPGDLEVDRWFHGPEFLRSGHADVDKCVLDIGLPYDDPELKVASRSCHMVISDQFEHPIDKLASHFSNWYRLKRAVAWWIRLMDRLLGRASKGGTKFLSVGDLKNSELVILKHVQRKCFPNEIEKLTGDKAVGKSSNLRSLDPMLDNHGLIVVGGRLRRCSLNKSFKHPYLISSNHPVARLIVSECHEVAHNGCEWVVGLVRKKFWITGLRRLVKGILKGCVKCRKLFAAPCSQKMADLPPERIESHNPPFSYTGVDCFGPFLVKQGRSEIKRYGCIFTCLNTRAIHLEKVNSLDTDSFINAFKRFTSRRGTPIKVWSDNGTNIVGAHKELEKNMKKIDDEMIHAYAVKMNVEWHFNPPTASHMGGIWERLIRTVRKVFVSISDINTRMSDEVLETMLCEVECIVNGRPITKVSDDVNDMNCLTPNHLLMLREQPSIDIGKFDKVDLYKRRWRCVQYLAQQFWTRWIREYIPELQKRQKWLKVTRNVKLGDVVLIVGENVPRGIWPMGLVQEIQCGQDGLVRAVKVKTKSTVLVRPITKLVLLEGVH